MLVIAPYDKGAMKAIEKAIQASDLGVNPSNDGTNIRLTFPELTTDRRKELVKVVKKRAEDEPGRGAQRAAGASARSWSTRPRTATISDDEVARIEKELEKLTHDVVAEIDTLRRPQGKRAARGVIAAAGRVVRTGRRHCADRDASREGEPLAWPGPWEDDVRDRTNPIVRP